MPPDGAEKAKMISSQLRGFFLVRKKMGLLYSVWKLLRHDGVFAFSTVWKSVEKLWNLRTGRRGHLIRVWYFHVFSQYSCMCAAFIRLIFLTACPQPTEDPWGTLYVAPARVIVHLDPFGSASIVWKIDEGDVSNGSWVFSDTFPYLYMYIIIYHITLCLYYASYILFIHFYSIQLAFRSVIAFPTWINIWHLIQATPSP